MAGEESGSGGESRGGEAGSWRFRGAAGELLTTARAVLALAEQKHLSFLAAAIAYYAFVSMIPLVVLGVAVATTVGGAELADRLVDLAGEILAPAGQEILRSAVTARTGLGGVTVVGIVVLVWGALKAFRALDRAFSLVYGSGVSSVGESFKDAAVVLVAVGVGTIAMLLAGAASSLLPGPIVGLASAVGLALTLVVLFLPVFYRFPDTPVSVRQVLPGTVLAALGWTLLGSVFQLYATLLAGRSIYGLLGAVLLALTWFYLGALVVLLGAAVNAVRSGHASPLDR